MSSRCGAVVVPDCWFRFVRASKEVVPEASSIVLHKVFATAWGVTKQCLGQRGRHAFFVEMNWMCARVCVEIWSGGRNRKHVVLHADLDAMASVGVFESDNLFFFSVVSDLPLRKQTDP